MNEQTLGRCLKRHGISQTRLREVLKEKYDYGVSQAQITCYCKEQGCPNRSNWQIVRKCLEIEFGIRYENGWR